MGVLRWASLRQWAAIEIDPVFGLNTESVGNAIDVVEVGADLGGVVDRPIVPSRFMEGVDIFCAHFGRARRQFLGVSEQRSGRLIEIGGTPVIGDPVYNPLSLGLWKVEIRGDLRPEIVEMRLGSVDALVLL